MAPWSKMALRAVEGQRVDLQLLDGRLMTKCILVSGGRARVTTLWLLADGDDVFVPVTGVASMRVSPPRPPLPDRTENPTCSTEEGRVDEMDWSAATSSASRAR